MKHKTSIALFGIGGYGQIYVSPLLDEDVTDHHGVRLIGCVDPNPAAAKYYGALTERGIPVYASTAELYADHRPEVVVIASPIQFHCSQTIEALAHGAHVLCEKPLAGSMEQVRQMQAAKDRSACQVAIGYQWSFSTAIQRLKADILAGRFGAARRCKTLVLWPRGDVYYQRNGWAGRRATATGPVLDSPVHNACAHFLHNMLYLLGDRVDRSAEPLSVTAELYRANAIETFDTASIRCRLAGGVELLFTVSHATAELREPRFVCEFEKATVSFSGERGARLTARFHDGATIDYGLPAGSSDAGKLWSAVASFNGGTPVLCGIEAATPQTAVVCAADEAVPNAVVFPKAITRVVGEGDKRMTAVDGLGATLVECHENWAMPSEIGATWAKAGSTVDVTPAASVTPATSVPAATAELPAAAAAAIGLAAVLPQPLASV